MTNAIPLPDTDADPADRNRRYYGAAALEALRQSRVAVIGAGAVGNELCKHLGMVGVGHIYLVDPDIVTDSNLNRCVLFRPGQGALRLPKVIAIQRAFAEHGFATTIDARPVALEMLDPVEWTGADLVLCGVDDDHARHFLNVHLLAAATADGQSRFLIEGAMGADFSQCRVLELPRTACLVCNWTNEFLAEMFERRRRQTCLEFFIETRAVFPAVATQTSLVAAQMATEAIKILCGLRGYRQTGAWPHERDGRMAPRIGHVLRYETPRHVCQVSTLVKNPRCVEPFCRGSSVLQ